MEGQNLVDETLTADPLQHSISGLSTPDQYHLMRTVVHRHIELATHLFDHRRRLVSASSHGQERGLWDAPFGRNPLVQAVEFEQTLVIALLIQHPGRAHGRVLTCTVTEHGVGLDPQAGEERVQGMVGRQQGLNGHIHLP